MRGEEREHQSLVQFCLIITECFYQYDPGYGGWVGRSTVVGAAAASGALSSTWVQVCGDRCNFFAFQI